MIADVNVLVLEHSAEHFYFFGYGGLFELSDCVRKGFPIDTIHYDLLLYLTITHK